MHAHPPLPLPPPPDNWPTLEPYFNETGSNCPSTLPLQSQKELVDLAVASCKASDVERVEVCVSLCVRFEPARTCECANALADARSPLAHAPSVWLCLSRS